MRPVAIHPLSVRQSLSGKHLLVTGVTGFLAKVWITHLLKECPEIRQITLLVRNRRNERAVNRVNHALGTSPALRPLRAEHGAELTALLESKLSVITGDIAKPMAGVNDAALESLADVDLVAHFAGTVDFQPDPVTALDINTRGAVHMADLAAHIGAPMVHVSTAYVAGMTSGIIEESIEPTRSPSGVEFDPADELRAVDAALAPISKNRSDRQARIDTAQERATHLGFANLYTYTKSLAERLLAMRDDVSVTIVRPTIVESARQFPFEGWNEGLNTSAPLAWLISTAFRDFPSKAHHHFDIAPVDLVARGMSLVAASAFTAPHGRVFHLGTSGSNPVLFGRIIELTGLANRTRLRNTTDATAFERLVVSQLDPVAVDANKRPLWHVSRLRKGAESLQKVLRKLDEREPKGVLNELAGETAQRLTRKGVKQTQETMRNLKRIEHMLELFQPFVHDHDYIFANHSIRALSEGLPAEEREAFAFDAETINWRTYWHDIQYPGLWKWCIPIITGGTVDDDRPLHPALDLAAADAPRLPIAEPRGAK